MKEVWLYAFASVILISLVSFIGLITFSVKLKKAKKFLIYMVSFSAGALFGNAFIHLLPEIIGEYGFTLAISLSILVGIISFFIIEKVIHWRHCHQHHHHHFGREHIHPFALMNLLGDAVHNLIDGVIIGASYLISIPAGIATTIAVALHEIPQEIGDFGVLLHGGFSRRKALLFNFFTALTALLGLVLAFTMSSRIENFTLFAIPFAAGGFIYIAGSDLIPEIHKEVKVKTSLISLGTFILGILVMVALLRLA